MQPLTGGPDGLITVSWARASGWSSHRITAAIRRGELVAVRRGVAVPVELWTALDDGERHVLLVRAE